MSMPSISSTPEKKKQTSLPPRRGQIKAQIFESLVKTVVSMASRARASSSAAAESSASTTPPASSYSSEGNSDA